MGEDTFADVPIATVRQFWDAHPCNIRHSPHPVGTREFFDDVERFLPARDPVAVGHRRLKDPQQGLRGDTGHVR